MSDHFGVDAGPDDHDADPPFFEGSCAAASFPAAMLVVQNHIHALKELLTLRSPCPLCTQERGKDGLMLLLQSWFGYHDLYLTDVQSPEGRGESRSTDRLLC